MERWERAIRAQVAQVATPEELDEFCDMLRAARASPEWPELQEELDLYRAQIERELLDEGYALDGTPLEECDWVTQRRLRPVLDRLRWRRPRHVH